MAQVLLRQQHALAVLAAGGDAEVPNIDDELEAFDNALITPPKADTTEDRERAELRAALGLPDRGHR